MATHHQLQYIPSPYCHSKGAFLTYDPETRILYTGDLFGGISNNERIDTLWAEESDWDGIMAFHQLYMPANKAIRYAIESIRALNPKPLMIAPQHGNIIRGDLVEVFINRLSRLPVGADLLDLDLDSRKLEQYRQAMNEILEFAVAHESSEKVVEKLTADSQFMALVKLQGHTIKAISKNPTRILECLVQNLCHGKSHSEKSQIKSVALKACVTHSLPVPSLDWEGTETGLKGASNLFDQ